MATPLRVVIVGGGQAGAAAAVALREGGFDGGITKIGAEPAACGADVSERGTCVVRRHHGRG